MVRQAHGAAPKRKKAAKKKAAKKVAKKSTGKSLRERAAAKKRTRKIADTLPREPDAPPSKETTRYSAEVVPAEPGEHPVDTIHAARVRGEGRKTLRTPVDDERCGFRKGPLSPWIIEDICRFLRYGCHRVTAERLMGLSPGRIKTWIQLGRKSREVLDAWHDKYDGLIEAGVPEAKAAKRMGAEPEPNVYALLHACISEAEANGEKTSVGHIVDAAVGGDWRASAWFLSRRYNKRWGEHAAKGLTSEEDDETPDGQGQSATEKLAEVLEDMFGRRKASAEDEGIP